ncbi:arginine N-methyltransferase 2 [Myriangium duriaei CBS 260.36]|uniref:Arginine N-methyltransferase 2 n=1 Tax=Myriangium duriaei CBS 260.36 TaxID=1168546 RepID=A0A9P4J889_9PEZI|nr:arginine N-methyltransferase 2 [Myriangium duriaei CBS 260.36]
MDIDVDLDTTAEEILLAATNHDTDKLTTLLKTGSANARDADSGYTPLHAAIAACEDDDDDPSTAPNTDAAQAISSRALAEEGAVRTVKLLLENGAIWNDLDAADETPGCMALRLGLKDVYELMVEAGVRAELLLNRLDDFQLLAGGDDDDDEDDEVEVGPEAEAAPEQNGTAHADTVPTLTRTDENGAPADPDVTSARYLASDLSFGGDRLLDADANGVMMSWETELMRLSASKLLSSPGKRVLNVGHGMGIIDGIFQSLSPAEHHIIEAHPAVLERMERDGWMGKEGVTVHRGRWQDVVPQLAAEGTAFDAIYFDTFAEDYSALREFFGEHVIALLAPDGKFGFFNGLGADRQVCYDVYTKVVEMDLFEAGLDTAWEEVKVGDLDEDGEWEGVRRKYWALDTYRLPTCTFVG